MLGRAEKAPRTKKRLGRGPRSPQARKGPEARKCWEEAQKPTKGPEKEETHKRPRRGPEARKGWKDAQAHKRPRKGPEARSANNLRRGEAGKTISNPVLMHKQKKPETQPLRKAPQPTSKKLVWDKLKPETFAQNFRSKLSVNTQGPKPWEEAQKPTKGPEKAPRAKKG